MIIMLKDVLKHTREAKGLKQAEVAEYVGVTAQTYMKWENGKNEPKAGDIKKLAEILGVSESEICRGKTFSDDTNPLNFMKKTALMKNALDEVTFTSVLFEYIHDKQGFIDRLEHEAFATEEAYRRYEESVRDREIAVAEFEEAREEGAQIAYEMEQKAQELMEEIEYQKDRFDI
ncbi:MULTISPECIES: helix-turn-helix transcriptional regulator [Vibrio]|nr:MULTISPECIES: helix-turn-helix transcriptional regulator [Vibrio]MBF4385655.1 XRE family transcriptional regulator [Vibrio anguillarum]MBF4395106.1 XRE family transcriptional regulator [Vibrio anguillarum]MBF4431484.1 XRE family transcriptional regulator [Vibrio anguillarum]